MDQQRKISAGKAKRATDKPATPPARPAERPPENPDGAVEGRDRLSENENKPMEPGIADSGHA